MRFLPRAVRRPFTSFVSVPALATALLLSPCLAGVARAQIVSDSDRAAARELFVEGVKLQEAGSFADALDRFTRAQAVFSAPTHLLHIAECEAALGRLVESAESYRTLVRTPLPAGSPNAFVQAQQQGAAELPQVEPRIPSIRLLVKPDRVPRLAIFIDSQPVSAALVGVQRPVDPGTHVIVVQAPGYGRSEQRVTVAEKETKDVTVTLAAGYTSASPYGVPPPPPQTYPTYQAQGGTGTVVTAPPPPPPPPEYSAARPRLADETESRGGFMLGVGVGALVPAGNVYAGNGGNGSLSMSDVAGSGPAVGIDAGFRFVHRLYIGMAYDHGFLGNGKVGNSASTNYLGVNLIYLSNPFGASFFGEIGGGYRWLDLTDSTGTYTASGGEFTFGVGVHFRLGQWVRLVPEISFSAGQFSPTNSLTQGADTHEFILFGVKTFLDFAKKHHAASQPPAE